MPSGVLCPVGLAHAQLKSVELLPLLPKSTGWLFCSLPISLAKPQFSDIFRHLCSSAWNPDKVGLRNKRQPWFFSSIQMRARWVFFFLLANLDWMRRFAKDYLSFPWLRYEWRLQQFESNWGVGFLGLLLNSLERTKCLFSTILVPLLLRFCILAVSPT